MKAFLTEELSCAGAEDRITPREIIRDFVTLLDLLYQNPGTSFDCLLSKVPHTVPENRNAEEAADNGAGAAGVPVGNGEFKADIEIVNPELWQTHDRADKSEQPLYEVIASLTSAGEIVDGRIEKTGLRKITLDTAPDEYGKNFRIILNDVPLFAKGANYIPPDIVYTTDKKRITDILDAVTFAGMNMLRVFGGSVYPDDFFFEESSMDLITGLPA